MTDANLTEMMQYLAAQSWQIAALTLVVAVAAFVLRRRGAHIRYLLWLIVVVKCLVPPLHIVSLSVVDHRLQWIFVTIGTIVLLSLILLLARYLMVSQRYAFQRPFGRPPAHAMDD